MTIREQLLHTINGKTKPIGSLGRLETVALKVGLIQQTASPVIAKPHIVVFAGDHGIARTGAVNPFPQEVTAQMVLNFLEGGAAINVFTRQHDIGLTVVDAGVNHGFVLDLYGPLFVNMKVAYGTKNYLETEAMTHDEAERAIERGRAVIAGLAADGCNTIGFGEMGIGNTASASLIMCAVTGLPLEQCVGRGTGANDEQLQRKLSTLKIVHEKHGLASLAEKPMELLCRIGGFEISMMMGAYLEAARRRMVIVVDGFIATAALLVSRQMDASVMESCVFAHRSGEAGHDAMLSFLGADVLLDLGLRLGEGTGSALAIPLIRSSVNFLNEMASFETANISRGTA
ncbi:MAG TPA: nicotinate-nucleotide--dimethylbenzimidazole phosphoribosyltransferase [Bacteroidota bacterium]|nr:nicotinate-nucleotide--dimethylbenzimidazole phosphoribosyltransferase [Bacteroidota bacterium]